MSPIWIYNREKPVISKNSTQSTPKTHINGIVRRHKRSEHGLEVGAPCRQDRLVRRNDLPLQHQVDVAKLLPTRLQKHRHIVLQRSPNRLVVLHIGRVLARILLLPDDLHDQHLLEGGKLGRHDDIVKVVVLCDKSHAVILDQGEAHAIRIVECVQNVGFRDFELEILHAQLLKAGDVELDGQLVHVHHEEDDLVAEWVLDWNLRSIKSMNFAFNCLNSEK